MKMLSPDKGCLLVSEPFLPDPNFHRSVILLTEHNAEGSLGFVINQPTVLTVQDLFDEFNCAETVYLGGPVAKNTFHYLHTISNLEGAMEIIPGVFWGGDFEMLKFLYSEDLAKDEKFVFLAGYSGWGPGQLEDELGTNAWIVAPGEAKWVFSRDHQLWKHVLSGMGGEFGLLSKAPEDVRLN